MKVSADVVYEGVKKGLNVTDEQLTNIIYKRIKLKSGKTKNRVWEDEENGRTYQFFRVDHEIYSKIVDGEDYSKYALMYDYDSYSTMKSENDWIFNCCIKGTKEDIIDIVWVLYNDFLGTLIQFFDRIPEIELRLRQWFVQEESCISSKAKTYCSNITLSRDYWKESIVLEKNNNLKTFENALNLYIESFKEFFSNYHFVLAEKPTFEELSEEEQFEYCNEKLDRNLSRVLYYSDFCTDAINAFNVSDEVKKKIKNACIEHIKEHFNK